jgi:hypothetical protein
MSKSNKDKKFILGSALAGLILAGPGLSVTATSNAKFFQTAQLNVGYREAQAAKKAKATPAPTPAPKEMGEKRCSPDGKCGPHKHCGKDSKDKHCCAKDDTKCDAMKHCAPAKPENTPTVKSDLPPPANTGKKGDKEMKCGEGACGK